MHSLKEEERGLVRGSPRDGAQRDPNKSQCVNPNVHTAADKHRSEMSMGLRLPKRPRRPHKSRRHHGGERAPTTPTQASPTDKIPPALGSRRGISTLTPSEQVQSLLSESDDLHNPSHDVFCEMDVLYKVGDGYQWRETARWVKYEEDVEEGGMRWSKPHVASLSLHALFELRNNLTSGACMLEMDAMTITQVADLFIDYMISQKLLEQHLKDSVRAAIVAQHCFQHQKSRIKNNNPDADTGKGMFRNLSMKRTLSEIGRSFSTKSKAGDVPSTVAKTNKTNNELTVDGMNGELHESASCTRLNEQFMRKIPVGSEAANILVGELECLNYQVVGLIRLCEGRNIGDITEVPIPTRFLFILLGPPGSQQKNVEIGRSMSTLMVDEVFQEVAYKARNREDILAGVDEFLDQVTALPPGEWDPKIRIEPPQSVPSQANRKVAKPITAGKLHWEEEEEEEESHCDPTLQRTGRLFGGLIGDIKRKLPWYLSDFKDSLHIQCVASIIYLYLATLTPNVTFGGLLGQATDQYMGTMECILTAAVVGVLFALFAGQPLNILGSTGPMLVLEMILYNFCKDQELDFLPFRAWIGLWTAFLLIVIVAFDLSALVRYITRFTEESFACLIAIIFIAEAFKKLMGILKLAPINTNPDGILNYTCGCFPPNTTYLNLNSSYNATVPYLFNFGDFDANETVSPASWDFSNLSSMNINWSAIPVDVCATAGGVPITVGCDTTRFVPDAFFLSVLLFIGTYMIATLMTNAKSSSYFPTFVRQTMSDFSVLIAIIAMVLVDYLINIPTPKLQVPSKFQPTRDDRGWFVNPISDKNPVWLIFAAALPAMLAVILIFMDQQITAVIVNRKENKLLKGNGYHLDMFVVAICIAICSLMGLPWYVAATVSAIAHIMSLKKESECTAPGERPTFLGVREQRVTALMVGILSGASVLFTTVLQFIPMAVLYGVFLYMGVAAMKGMQFIDRLKLMLQPAKYQPDFTYLRHVPIKRVHLFTIIQLICLAGLWVIKSIKELSIVFPILVLGTCFVRKALDYIFTQRDLKWLDDLMPEATKKEKEDERKKSMGVLDDEVEEDVVMHNESFSKFLDLKIGAGKKKSYDLEEPVVSPSDDIGKPGIWLQLKNDSKNALLDAENGFRGYSKMPVNDKPNSHNGKSNNNENAETSALNGETKRTTFFMGEEEA